VTHNQQSAFCFTLIHVQLQFPAALAQTKTSYSLFNKMVYWHNNILGYKLRID